MKMNRNHNTDRDPRAPLVPFSHGNMMQKVPAGILCVEMSECGKATSGFPQSLQKYHEVRYLEMLFNTGFHF